MQAKLQTQIRIGKAAVDWRDNGIEQNGARDWASGFIAETWGCQPGESDYDKLYQRVKRCIKLYEKEQATGGVLQKPDRNVVPGGNRCRVVNPQERVRVASRTRQPQRTRVPELQHELFHWWVDHAQVLQARVPTSAIMAQANLMVDDAKQYAREQEELHGIIIQYVAPKVTRVWISRWSCLLYTSDAADE